MFKISWIYIYNMEEDSFLLVSEEKIGLYTATTLQNIRYRQIYTNRYKNVISGIENYVQHISFHNLCILKLFIIIMYFSAKITQTFKLKRGKFYFPLALHQHLPPITFLETVKLLLHQMQFSNFLPPGTNAAAVTASDSYGQLSSQVLGSHVSPFSRSWPHSNIPVPVYTYMNWAWRLEVGGLRFS